MANAPQTGREPVKMLDLPREFKLYGGAVRAAVEQVLAHQRFVLGPEVAELERHLARRCGTREAVAVSSGSDALLATLMLVGCAAGDEVITTSFTFFSTAGSIHRTGARPVFVDIEPDTFNLDPRRLEAAITPRTRAIVAVHLFGQCAEMDEILAIAARHDVPVIEDACQAIGATYRGRPAGSMGLAGCLSFYPTKNLGAIGEGGMIVTNDAEFAERCRLVRNQGQVDRYRHAMVGGNFRMDSITAAALLAKLPHLDAFQDRRRRNAERYRQLLADTPVRLPPVREHQGRCWHQYSILTDERDALRAFLTDRGVQTAVYYPVPLHQQDCFASLGYHPGDLPVTEETARGIVSLPIQPMLTDEQVKYAAAQVRAFHAGRNTASGDGHAGAGDRRCRISG